MLGLDKNLPQPIAGYWGLEMARDEDGYGSYTETVEQPQVEAGTTDVTANSATTETIAAIGTVAATVIDALKGNNKPTQNIVAPRNNTPTPIADNGKKPATIFWIVGGVVVVATLLYLAFKPRK